MERTDASYKSPVVLGVLLIALPLLMGGAFAGAAFLLDLTPLGTSVGVARSGVSGLLAGLVIGAASLLNIRRHSGKNQ
ncbi:hypothetical protein ACX80J_09435 [Arthrobacter sp. MDB2-24]